MKRNKKKPIILNSINMDYQGKKLNQIKYSEDVSSYCIGIFVLFIIFMLIYKIIKGL